MSTLLTAETLLRQHGIDYVATRNGKFTTCCPECGQGYLNVVVDGEGAKWFCHHCNEGSGAKFEEARKDAPKDSLGPIKAVYDYTDEAGSLLFQVLRFEPVNAPKQFRQRKSPDQEKWSIKGVRLVPYRLAEIMEGIAVGGPVFIVEGEKDVDNLWRAGIPATCNPMGAGKWRPDFSEAFRGADVVLCGDNDAPGKDHIRHVAASLHGVAARVRCLDLWQWWPDIQPSGDISDWLEEPGHTAKALWTKVAELPDYRPRTNGNGAAQEDAPNGFRILSAVDFIKGFIPPDYLIDGILQRRFIYALTGQTGHAKTAVALLIARQVASSDANACIGTHRVEKGRVVYFVGENPDDVRMRIIGANAKRTDQVQEDNLWFIPGVFDIAAMQNRIAQDAHQNGDISLLIIDTSAAYFLGNEELSNTQMGSYARMLRTLTTLPGGPCVLVLCHPIKHVVEPAQLLPRGGGAYLAEMDGNLTLWRLQDDMVELSYNKMRGPGFQNLTFKLEQLKCDELIDKKGRQISTVQAVVIGRQEEEERSTKANTDEDMVLAAMLKDENRSFAFWAEKLDWRTDSGEPYKKRVERIVDRLNKDRLAKKVRGKWTLTDAGREMAREAGLRFKAERDAKEAREGQEAMF